MFLKQEAFIDYNELTQLSFNLGYITIFELIKRYKMAITLIDKENPLRDIIIRELEFLGVHLETLDKELEWDNSDQSDCSSFEQEGIEKTGLEQKSSDRFDLIRASRKNTWNFRPGDPDFFPSIPHGHNYKNINLKLDPYRGEVFDVVNDKQLKSEDRKFIIELWNDDDFRDIARRAIDHYATNVNPMFVWRVQNFKRLPRKRRI